MAADVSYHLSTKACNIVLAQSVITLLIGVPLLQIMTPIRSGVSVLEARLI